MEPFGDKLYAWERQYFTDNVLAGRIRVPTWEKLWVLGRSLAG